MIYQLRKVLKRLDPNHLPCHNYIFNIECTVGAIYLCPYYRNTGVSVLQNTGGSVLQNTGVSAFQNTGVSAFQGFSFYIWDHCQHHH